MELIEKEKDLSDTSCGLEEEGQAVPITTGNAVTVITPISNNNINESIALSAESVKKSGKGSISVMV